MRNLFCSTLALLFLSPSLPARGQEPGSKPAATTASATPRNITIEDYFQIRDVSQPELSPDGQWVAYTVRSKILKEDKNEQRLWMVPTHGRRRCFLFAPPLEFRRQIPRLPLCSKQWQNPGLAFESSRRRSRAPHGHCPGR